MLRRSMIQNFVCLEFNKDMGDIMQKYSIQDDNNVEAARDILKDLADLQERHNIFSKALPSSRG